MQKSSPPPRIKPISHLLLDADFFVGQVAGGILGPFVAVVGFGAGAEVAAADVQEAALGAAALDVGLLVLELVQEFDVRVVPDLGEGAFEHVAEHVVTPELVGGDVAVPGNAADAAAGAVAFVELQEFEHFFGALGVFLQQAHPAVGAVGMVVHGEDFLGHAGVEAGAGLIHDEVHDLAGLLMVQVFVDEFGAAAGVHEMVEADAGDLAFAEDLEDLGHFNGVTLVDGEAQADLDAFFAAVFETFEGAAERALHSTEVVMHLFAAIEGNAHVGEAHVLEHLGHVAVDESTVGGDNGAHALGGSVAGQLGQVLADGGFGEGGHRCGGQRRRRRGRR